MYPQQIKRQVIKASKLLTCADFLVLWRRLFIIMNFLIVGGGSGMQIAEVSEGHNVSLVLHWFHVIWFLRHTGNLQLAIPVSTGLLILAYLIFAIMRYLYRVIKTT